MNSQGHRRPRRQGCQLSPCAGGIGASSPNGYGFYDMAGNVWQWCWDWYGSYGSVSQTDPRGASSGSYRVVRGGCYDNYAIRCRSADRFNIYPANSISNGLGFRCALAVGQ